MSEDKCVGLSLIVMDCSLMAAKKQLVSQDWHGLFQSDISRKLAAVPTIISWTQSPPKYVEFTAQTLR